MLNGANKGDVASSCAHQRLLEVGLRSRLEEWLHSIQISTSEFASWALSMGQKGANRQTNKRVLGDGKAYAFAVSKPRFKS